MSLRFLNRVLSLSDQIELPAGGRPRSEMLSRKLKRTAPIHPQATAADLESLPDELRVRALPAHPRSEVGIVVPSVPHGANERHNVLGTLRQVIRQPFAKQLLHLVRQPQHDIACRTRSGLGARF